ncbi:hypothetical protein ES708_31800 [subsurface metagenome]
MKEWCPVCNGKWEKGMAMKPGHARRFAGWYPKAQTMDGVGYWTFTIPPKLRYKYRTKEELGELGKAVVKMLKRHGYSRGLRRWHWFGDRSPAWHPHLNCLVDGGSISKAELRSIRREYSELLGVKLAIAQYHYFDTPGEKVHKLKYITRATFLDVRWDMPMAKELKGFRNTWCWGGRKWKVPAVWSLDDLPGKVSADMSDEDTSMVASLEEGKCPRCGLPIQWERWLPISILPAMGGRDLGAGYWELPCVRPPPYRLDLSISERIGGEYGKLAKTIGGSYVSADIARSGWAKFFAQHRRRATWLRGLEAIKSQAGTLPTEVLELAEKSFVHRSSPPFSHAGDKTVHQPNCLGGVSLVGEN